MDTKGHGSLGAIIIKMYYDPGVEVLGYRACVCSALLGTDKPSYKIVVPSYTATSRWDFQCSLSSSVLGVVSPFHFSRSARYVVVLHFCFNLCFPGEQGNGSPFCLCSGHVNILFGELPIQVSCHPFIGLAAFFLPIFKSALNNSIYENMNLC